MKIKKGIITLLGVIGLGSYANATTEEEPLPTSSTSKDLVSTVLCSLFSCDEDEMLDGLEGIDQTRIPGDDHNPTTICG